jgi:hypothetical protein
VRYIRILDRFKAWGWFLDDLVLTPVNNLTQWSALQDAERHKAASRSELRNISQKQSCRFSLASKRLWKVRQLRPVAAPLGMPSHSPAWGSSSVS